MAVNDDKRDDGLERDPRLARLYQAASSEEPPSALDAAILAAARREVGARPQVVGGGAVTSVPPVRTKRNWYVPVSIAAVMVLSVSLVTLVHQEKGDELSQPPTSGNVPQSASVPPKASVPASVAAPADDATASAARSEKSDATLRDAAPVKAKRAEEKQAEPAKVIGATAAPEAYDALEKKQRTEKAESTADSASVARKDQAAGGTAREQGPASETAPALKTTPGIALGRFAAGTQPSAPAAAARERRPEPFPSTSEREVPASAPAPAQASRDDLDARARSEADRNMARGAMQEAPAVPVAPPAPVAAAPRRAAPAEDVLAQSAPSQAEGRVLATPPPPASKPAAPPPPKVSARLMEKRAPLWRGLEEQPPEKWLERLAEFKRDGRQADADELLAEFRRRFPDHPASAR